jgi:hypothetical protein
VAAAGRRVVASGARPTHALGAITCLEATIKRPRRRQAAMRRNRGSRVNTAAPDATLPRELSTHPHIHCVEGGLPIREVTVSFDDFGWSRLAAEAEAQDVSVAEIVVHATMYYLGDLDSGRVTRRVLPTEEAPEPDG